MGGLVRGPDRGPVRRVHAADDPCQRLLVGAPPAHGLVQLLRGTLAQVWRKVWAVVLIFTLVQLSQEQRAIVAAGVRPHRGFQVGAVGELPRVGLLRVAKLSGAAGAYELHEQIVVCAWEKQVLSARGFKRVGRHSEYAV